MRNISLSCPVREAVRTHKAKAGAAVVIDAPRWAQRCADAPILKRSKGKAPMLKLHKRIDKFSRRILNNRAHIVEDLGLVLRHAWTLPYLATPWCRMECKR